jgi:hypothetical protein
LPLVWLAIMTGNAALRNHAVGLARLFKQIDRPVLWYSMSWMYVTTQKPERLHQTDALANEVDMWSNDPGGS